MTSLSIKQTVHDYRQHALQRRTKEAINMIVTTGPNQAPTISTTTTKTNKSNKYPNCKNKEDPHLPLIEAIKKVTQENEHLKQQLNEQVKKFDELKLDSWEKVQAYDKRMADAYIELANKIQPLKLSNYNNIAVLGSVSVGKSTIVNTLIGKKSAEVGAGETTTKTSVYKGNGLHVYDVL
ncbi:unnamed protein product [Rotaria sp. Silwood1]|nr:unnamed protein product [Rotaria sp. Silwood1]